jgi:hypothetical protein
LTLSALTVPLIYYFLWTNLLNSKSKLYCFLYTNNPAEANQKRVSILTTFTISVGVDKVELKIVENEPNQIYLIEISVRIHSTEISFHYYRKSGFHHQKKPKNLISHPHQTKTHPKLCLPIFRYLKRYCKWCETVFIEKPL